jgi:hypothetical protein
MGHKSIGWRERDHPSVLAISPPRIERSTSGILAILADARNEAPSPFGTGQG